MGPDELKRLARDAEGEEQQHGMWRMHVEDLERFAALIEAHLKEQGYRQCATGQRTTQFCGMVEKAVQAEQEGCARVAEKHWDNLGIGQRIAAAIRSRT